MTTESSGLQASPTLSWAHSIVSALGTWEELQMEGGVTTRNGLTPGPADKLTINYEKNKVLKQVSVEASTTDYTIFHFSVFSTERDADGALTQTMNLDSFKILHTEAEVVAHLKETFGL